MTETSLVVALVVVMHMPGVSERVRKGFSLRTYQQVLLLILNNKVKKKVLINTAMHPLNLISIFFKERLALMLCDVSDVSL